MILLLLKVLLNGLFCALAVKVLKGDAVKGLVAGLISGAIFNLLTAYIPVPIFIIPYSFIFLPILVTALLLFYIAKLGAPKSIIAAAITYAATYVVGIYILPTALVTVGLI